MLSSKGGPVQELWNILLKYAAIPALVCAGLAAYYLVGAYGARRASKSALFDAERQVTADRMTRSSVLGLGLLGIAFLLFGLALIGLGATPTAEQPTRIPTRTVTPRAGTTPGPLASPTLLVTSSLPTVPPPPGVTNTPKPVVSTPAAGGRKTAVVTGTSDAGGLKLRRVPSPGGELIDTLPDGTVVELLGETKSDSGIEWQKVKDPKGREGWVAGQYLIFNP
jgi:hypothetical protein